MPVALPLTSKLSANSTAEIVPTALIAQFDDGYEAAIPSGINNVRDRWNISYNKLTQTEANTVYTFIRAVGGWDTVLWTPIGESVQKKFRIEGNATRSFFGAYHVIGFTLRQVF